MKSLQERLLLHIMRITETGCWIWMGSTDGDGYGQINLGNGKLGRAARVSYALFKGTIPNGLHVLHSCDIRPCINPDHLHLGTHQENMAEMILRGRDRKATPHGEKHGRSKLTECQVISIRADFRKYREIAADYGVAATQIYKIKNHITWRHVA